MINNLSHLSPPSLNTPLFGNQELSDATYKQIIDTVHDYILKNRAISSTVIITSNSETAFKRK